MNTIEKIINARKNKVTIENMTFNFLRPTDYQMARFEKDGPMEKIARYVIGWDGVNEIDLFESGDPEPAVFSVDLLKLWGEDHMDILIKLLKEINKSYETFIVNREESLGKLEAGSNSKTSQLTQESHP
mgnify:CR=1 FL=1